MPFLNGINPVLGGFEVLIPKVYNCMQGYQHSRSFKQKSLLPWLYNNATFQPSLQVDNHFISTILLNYLSSQIIWSWYYIFIPDGLFVFCNNKHSQSLISFSKRGSITIYEKILITPGLEQKSDNIQELGSVSYFFMY